LFFFTSPVSGGAAVGGVGDVGNPFFGSRGVSTDLQSGQVCLFVLGQPTLGD